MSISLERKERNVGIELLRIVSMFAVAMLHVLGQGGVLSKAVPGSVNYQVAWILEILSFFGVTTYGLISGYVGFDGNYRITNIIYTWLQVFFYTFIGTVVTCIVLKGLPNIEMLKKTFFPILSETYWYFSAYAVVFLLMPFINYGVGKFARTYLNIILITIIAAFCIAPLAIKTDVFGLREGLSCVWLLAAYYIGAYLKRFGMFSKMHTGKLLLLIGLALVLTWASKFILELVLGYDAGTDGRSNVLIAYNSPTVLLISVCLLMIFSKITAKGKIKKWILRISPLCFGVYLLNCNPFVWDYLMPGRFEAYAFFPVWKMVVCSLLAAMVIFLSGIAVDGIRFLIFEIGHLREKLGILNGCALLREISGKKDK